MTDSSDDPTATHRRRPRYRGTHPRRFSEKYKELAPAHYPDIVAHLRARGQTPAGQHVPALVDEALAALALEPGQRGIDVTLGWGGHAQHFLDAIAPTGQLLALDADPIELPRAETRLRALGYDAGRLLVRRTNFAGVRAAMDAAGWHDGVDFLFADLGVSSMQIDDPARGFSFTDEGPLDMRMNPYRGVPAARWLGTMSVDALAEALDAYADEPHARRIAAALVARAGALSTTTALSAAVRDAVGEDEAAAAVRRVFQAVRIAVNDELGALDALLRQLPDCLRPGGRAVVLTFHSGEDRRVKRAFETGLSDGVYVEVPRDVVRATPIEQRANPRAKAAKLRSARRAP